MLSFKSAEEVREYKEVKRYKKYAQVEVVQIDVPFRVETWIDGQLETVFEDCEPGDYVCIGNIKGEVWRVQKDIFEHSYEPLLELCLPDSPGVFILEQFRDYYGFLKIDKFRFSYKLPNGGWVMPKYEHLVMERGDAIALLVYNTDTEEFEFARQFRIATYKHDGGWITELPAGGLNEDEEASAAAARELEEELGYVIAKKKLQYIMTFYVSPGGSSERIVLYYAEVCNRDKKKTGGGLVHESEFIIPVSMSPQQALISIYTGEIKDAKTIAAILWWHQS